MRGYDPPLQHGSTALGCGGYGNRRHTPMTRKLKKFNYRPVRGDASRRRTPGGAHPLSPLSPTGGPRPLRCWYPPSLSLRTKDEVTSEAAARLFASRPAHRNSCWPWARPRPPGLIYPVGFYPTKARRLAWRSAGSSSRPMTAGCRTASTNLLELPGVGRQDRQPGDGGGL